MIFRLSQKLNAKIKAGTLVAMPLDENPYADWSCHLFTVDRTQCIILSNTKSLYSCVMYGKGITDEGIFIDRALTAIREFMQDDGQQFVHRKFIVPASEEVKFAKALNRSVTGSMNELIEQATFLLIEKEMSAFDVGFELNDILLSALASEASRGYGKPNEAFKMLSGARNVTDGGDG